MSQKNDSKCRDIAPLTLGSLTPCQSFARNCLIIFTISLVLIFYRDHLIFIMSLGYFFLIR